MFDILRSAERGAANHGWLVSRHTFSFADYHNPKRMGYRNLRVINEDRVAGGGGFPPHPHRHMEIISYVLEGGLQHRDSMGNGSIIRPGDVQRMSAGHGIVHSEFNASASDPVRFLQIWILPDSTDVEPGYEQKNFGDRLGDGLTLVAAPDTQDGAVRLHADARMYAARLEAGQEVRHAVPGGRGAWIQVARGTVRAGEHVLHQGDGASIEGPVEFGLAGVEAAEVLVFDLV